MRRFLAWICRGLARLLVWMARQLDSGLHDKEPWGDVPIRYVGEDQPDYGEIAP